MIFIFFLFHFVWFILVKFASQLHKICCIGTAEQRTLVVKSKVTSYTIDSSSRFFTKLGHKYFLQVNRKINRF